MSTNKNANFSEVDLGTTGKIVAANVARLREAYGLSYQSLSTELKHLGHPIPPLGLRRIEARARKVTVDDLLALANALGVSPARLLLGKSTDEPFGTSVPEDVTHSETRAWIEGKLEGFAPMSRWHFWREWFDELLAEVQAAERQALKYEEALNEEPDNERLRKLAAVSQASLARSEKLLAEAGRHLEELRIILQNEEDRIITDGVADD